LSIDAKGLVSPVRLLLCAPQLEPKPYATPFCVRARSANPGTRLRFAKAWADAFLEHPNRLVPFQQPTAHNRDLVERLWRLLTLPEDHRFSFQCVRLYRALWGQGRPPVASPAPDAVAEQRAQAALQRKGYYTQERIKNARNTLHSTHAKRRTDLVLKVSLSAGPGANHV
jgi:hypothetical protein